MTTKYTYMDFEFDRKMFADDLKKFRKHLGFTQAEMDEFFGVSLANTYEYENARQLPTVRNFLLMCNAMDVNPSKYWVLKNG